MGKIVTLASGKGGVGKTVITAALGAALAAAGKKVLLLDGDMGLRDLDLVLGFESRVLFDVFDVATGRCFEQDAILAVRPGLDFLPASQSYRWEEVLGDSVLTVLEDMRDRYDYILVDSPAGIGKGLYYTLCMADEILLIVEPTWVSVRDTDRVMGYLHEEKMFRYGLVFNNFHRAAEKDYLPFDEVYRQLQPEYLAGVLPHAREVIAAAQKGEVAELEKLGGFGACLQVMAACLINESERPPQTWSALLEKNYTAHLAAAPSRLQKRREAARIWRSRRR